MATATSDPADPPAGRAPAARRPPGLVLPPAASAAFTDVRALLRARADEEPLDRLLARMRRSAGEPASVVVVGEVGRGKSSVVNALLGEPGLSPVGAGETTGGYLRFAPESDRLPAGTAEVELSDARQRVPAADLARWVCIGARGADDAPALGATVAVARPFGGAVVVDTPGAGGLDQGHARLAIAQTDGAGILVLVTDTTAPLTTHALRFLDDCARRVAAVVVVVNKIDLTRAWSERVAENRDILRTHGYDGVPVVGFSALAATAALASADPGTRARAERASNQTELTEVLRHCLDRADVLPVAAGLRAARALVEPVAAHLLGDRVAATADGATADELGRRAERLEALQDARASWTYDWDAATSALRRDLEDEVEDRVEDFARRWTSRLTDRRWGLSPTALATLSVDVLADLTVIEQDVLELVGGRFAVMVAELYAQVGLEPGPGLLLELESLRPSAPVGAAPEVDQPTDLTLQTFMPAWMGFRLGTGLAGALGLTGAIGGAAATALGGAGAVALVGAGLHLTSMQKRKAAMLSFVRDRRSTLRRRLGRACAVGFDEVRTTVRKDFDRRLAEELRAAREQHAAARRAATADAERSADTVRQIDHDLRLVGDVTARLDAALGSLLA